MSSPRSEKNFWTDTGLVAASNLLVKSRTLLAVPLITWNLGLGGLGAWSQVWASANLIAAVAPFNVHVFMIRQVASRSEGSERAYSSSLGFALFTGLLVVFTMLIGRAEAGVAIFGSAGFASAAVWTGLLALALSVRGVALNQYRAHGRFVRRSTFELLASVVELGVLFAGWRAGSNLNTLILWMVVGNLVLSAATAVDVFRYSRPTFPDLKFIKAALAYGVPLLPLTLSAWVLDRIDRFFITHQLGLSALGEYSTVYSLAGVVLIFQAPVQMTLFPKLSELWKTNAPQALQLVEKSLVLLLSLSVATGALLTVTCTGLISRLLSGAASQDLSATCAAVSAGLCAYSVFSVTSLIFYAESKTRILGLSSAGAALLNCGLNLWLIPLLGILGAALATTISYAAPAALLGYLTRTKVNWPAVLRPLAAVCVGVVPGIVFRSALGGSGANAILSGAMVGGGVGVAGLVSWRAGLLKRWF